MTNIYKLLQVFECKQGALRAVRFNVDGGYCITCGSDKSLKLWNPHKASLIYTYSGHGNEVLDAKCSCDNSTLVSCGLDKTVIVWDVSSGEARRRLRGHAARINTVCMNEESTVAMSGSVDGSVRVWDLKSRNKEPIQILEESKDSVTCVSVSGSEILTSSLDGFYRIYDIRKGILNQNRIGESITYASFTSDGQCVLVSSVNSGLRLMDKANGEPLATYKSHSTTDLKIESGLGHDDMEVFSGSEDGFVYCWNLISANVLQKLEHVGSRIVHSISAHPSQDFLLSASLGQVWVWKKPSEDED